jgi:hypothetical protein
MTQQLFPGLLVRRGAGKYRHHIGGSHEIRGADCPNCAGPLTLFASLDLTDQRLRLGAACAEFPLLYCMRCCLCWYDFAYRRVSDGEIEILKAHRGPDRMEDWPQYMPDVLPTVPVTLGPVSPRLQEMMDEFNTSSRDPTAAEGTEWNLRLDRPPNIWVEPVNQVGGRSMLIQGLDDPQCPVCRSRHAYFLASLCNDEQAELKVAPDAWDAQIVFFFRPECQAVVVKHSIT